MKERVTIKRGQFWQSKRNDQIVEIVGWTNGHWKCRKLTERPGVYNGTHSLHEHTLRQAFTLL